MGTPRSEESFDELFAHEEWVRKLALRLCGASADDVAQETWIEALRHPREFRSARAWLGGIVRHVARRVRRESRERHERELAAARETTNDWHEATHGARKSMIPDPAALLARAELQHRVLAAVASLDEPYRVVVLLRYYEGLRTEDIAARLALPASTVRNRLARAHERLRARLDHEYGGDHAAWSMLFAPSLASLAPHPVAVGVGITMKLVALSIATAVALGAFVFWRSTTSDISLARRAAIDLANSLPKSALDSTLAAPAAGGTTSARAPAAADSAPRVERVLLSGAIRGGSPAELAVAEITLWDSDGTEHRASVGKSATYSSFGFPPGEKELFASCRGFVPLSETFDLPRDQSSVHHDIELHRALVLPVRITARGGGRVLRAPNEVSCEPFVIATLDRPMRIANVVGRMASGDDVASYRASTMFNRDSSIPSGYDGVLEIYSPPPVWVSCVLHDAVLESRVVRGNESELVFEIDPVEVESKLGGVSLTCIDASNGAFVEGTRVELWFRDAGGSSGKTDDHGAVHIDRLAPGMRRVIVTAPKLASFERWVRIAPGQTLDLGAIELQPHADGSGRVVDENGQGVQARLIAIPERMMSSARAVDPGTSGESASSGAFHLTWTERGAMRLVAVHDDFALGAIDIDVARSSASDLEIRLVRGTPVTFRVAPKSARSIEFVIADSEGRPLRLVFASPGYAPRVRLKPGRYELRVVEDDDIVRRESLEVGNEPIVKEIQP